MHKSQHAHPNLDDVLFKEDNQYLHELLKTFQDQGNLADKQKYRSEPHISYCKSQGHHKQLIDM